ncbi:MAG: phage integrase N-terminal SAM-like domain-containing protein, partial [Candidatus Methanoperedens sp.]|nr:phage integrase N-terminal SAM-like domain-containing protein [Candidatus Methanoperedens sp.]
MRVQLSLADLTVKSHINNLNVFLRQVKKPINELIFKDVQNFMLWIKENKSRKTYGNYLCTMKVLFRDYLKMPEIINDFKFPSIAVKPKK